MLIPLGILASSRNGGAGSFDLISTTILGSSAASVTFDVTGLGSTYKHLQIRAVTRFSSGTNPMIMRFNSDSTYTNYRTHWLWGNGSSVSSDTRQASGYTGMSVNQDAIGSDFTANVFGPSVIDILDPFSSSKNKTVRSLVGTPGTYNNVRLQSGLWMNTAAVTSITLLDYGSSNFITGSRFSIYGVK
jgi:hypothetical protein